MAKQPLKVKEVKTKKKAVLKTAPTKASVSSYLNGIEDLKRRQDCQTLSSLMERISGEKPVLWGKDIVGFQRQTLKYESGRELDWMKIGFSSRKGAISIYLTCDLTELEEQLKLLGDHKRGVGCLYVKSLDDIDIKILERLIKASLRKKN